MIDLIDSFVIEGAGKGGSTPTEAPDSLFSNNIGHIIDALGEGEIEGLVGDTEDEQKQSIYYNEVQLNDAQGTVNFSGVIVVTNNGTPDQPALPGFDDTESTIAVSQELPYNIYKTISFVNDGSITAVAVTISVSDFFEVNKDGDTNGTTCSFVIERSQNSGSFEVVYNGAITGKQTDEYDVDYRVPVTDPVGTTAIRVKRTKVDSTSLKINDKINFKEYTKIVEHKFSYPNIALVGHTFDAKQFGNQLPTRQYRVRGIKCRIPHNYDPVARTYTGPFNGSLKAGKFYTNNPVWIFLELVTNKRFGLGRFFNENLIDIPSLYQTSKWCDEPVTVHDGVNTYTEPRWVCNTVINSRGQAFDVLKDLVSCFRGSLFWMQAKLWAFGDQPRTPVKIVTNKNVIDGKFTYSGESNRNRYSVINVTYNDPDMLFRSSIESVENPDLIREIGYKTNDFGAFGCSSRSQAQRLGRAILFSQEFESELVSYSASFDHMAVSGDGPDGLAPGDLVLLADRERGNAVAGGTIRAVQSGLITLDRPTGNGTGTVYIEHKDGSLEWLTCVYADIELVVNGETKTFGQLTLTEVPVQPVALNEAYILIENGFEPEPFVVLKISRSDKHIVDISAVRYDEARYAAIYDDVTVDPTKYMSLAKPDVCQPVSNLTAADGYITGIDVYQRVINISWTKSPDVYLSYNVVSYSKDNNDWKDLPIAGGTSAQITDARSGVYRIRVAAVNRAGIYSSPVYFDLTLDDVPADATLPVGTISNLTLDGGGTTFSGQDAKFSWKLNTPQSTYTAAAGLTDSTAVDGAADPMFRDCLVTIRAVGDDTILRSESVQGTTYVYTYEKNFEDTDGAPMRTFRIGVSYRDLYGRTSVEVQLTVTNPAPVLASVPGALSGADSIFLFLPAGVDTDYATTKVYGSLVSPVVISNDNLRFVGTDSNPIIPSFGSTTHYFVAVPCDVFGPGTASPEFSARPLQITETIQQIVGAANPDDILSGAQDFVDSITAALTAQLNGQLLAEDRKARIDKLTHLDGVALNTRVKSEIDARIEGDTAIVTRVDQIESDFTGDMTTVTALISDEAETRASADAAETSRRQEDISTLTTALNGEVDDRIASITSEQTTRAAADEAETDARNLAVSDLYTAIGDAVTETEASIADEATTRATADEAETSTREVQVSSLTDSINFEVATRQAAIASEATTRADADTAETDARETAISTLTTALASTNAALDTESTTRATADEAETSARESAVASITTDIGTLSAALNTEQTTRADADSAETDARNTAISLLNIDIGNITAAIDSEATTRAAADTAETDARTTAISDINTALAQTNAAIETEASTRATNDGAETDARETAISTLTTDLNNEVSNREAAISSEASTRAYADGVETDARNTAISDLTTTINNEVTNRQAEIASEASTRADAISAETDARELAISTLSGSLGDINASITNEATTRASETGALSSSVTSLSTTVGDQSASISLLFSTINGDQATAQLLIDVNGHMSGFKVNGSDQSFVIDASSFQIVNPSGGAGTVFSDGNWRVTFPSGNLAVRMGVWNA